MNRYDLWLAGGHQMSVWCDLDEVALANAITSARKGDPDRHTGYTGILAAWREDFDGKRVARRITADAIVAFERTN